MITRLEIRPIFTSGQTPFDMSAEVEPTVGTFLCTKMWNMSVEDPLRAMGDTL